MTNVVKRQKNMERIKIRVIIFAIYLVLFSCRSDYCHLIKKKNILFESDSNFKDKKHCSTINFRIDSVLKMINYKYEHDDLLDCIYRNDSIKIISFKIKNKEGQPIGTENIIIKNRKVEYLQRMMFIF